MGDRVRVLVADDSGFVRRAVERMLSVAPNIEVVGEAATGEEAIRLATELRPDVVILDVNMPELDGLEALKRIMEDAPTGVLMLSTHTHRGAGTTMSALELGAVDFLDKSTVGTVMDLYRLGPALREKVMAVANAAVRGPGAGAASAGEAAAPSEASDVMSPVAAAEIPAGDQARAVPEEIFRRHGLRSRYDVVAIGASTGGPRALAEVLSKLPAAFGAGIVVAQHMPAGFTHTLASRLDRRSEIEVREARDGDEIRPGLALVIPGGMHGTVVRHEGALELHVSAEPELIHRPNINLLFSSVAEAAGGRAVGLVLTGMGDDGARGLDRIRDAGGYTIAESESSAVIFGMPRAAAPHADRIVPLPEIAATLAALCAPTFPRNER